MFSVGSSFRILRGLDRMRAGVLAVIAPATGRTHALTLEILDHLLGGREVLDSVKNRLAFGYAHPQGLQGQLHPLQFRHATPKTMLKVNGLVARRRPPRRGCRAALEM